MTGQSRSQTKPDPAQWGRWFGRPGRSLTRRLIWLAAAWILIALAAAAVVESLAGGFRWPPGWDPRDAKGTAR